MVCYLGDVVLAQCHLFLESFDLALSRYPLREQLLIIGSLLLKSNNQKNKSKLFL